MNPLVGMIDIETDPQTINGFTEVCALPLLDHVSKGLALCHRFQHPVAAPEVLATALRSSWLLHGCRC